MMPTNAWHYDAVLHGRSPFHHHSDGSNDPNVEDWLLEAKQIRRQKLAPGAGFEPAISTLTAWRCASSTTPDYCDKSSPRFQAAQAPRPIQRYGSICEHNRKLPRRLLQQQHFVGFIKAGRGQAVKVHAARHLPAAVVAPVPC